MSNSSLVSYTRITNNKTSPRNHAIDTVTIHCIVGQWTAKQGCDYFATTDRQCSANYVVGKDGDIGLSVDEKDRSWCSSSRDNDNRAITIEVASDATHPYAVTAKAYEALIALVADICKRNGIKRLLWKADKSLIGQVDKQNMTVHRWFANKECPGEYLYSRHGEIADRVNAILSAAEKPEAVTPSAPVESVDNPSTIWNFFKGKGLNNFAVAGIMGNIYAESGFKPTNLQNSYEKALGYTDDSYTAAVDSGAYTNFVKDSAGYGLVQWTYWSRKEALLGYARSVGKSIGDLGMQLDFMWKEMQGYKSMMTTLNEATSVAEASNAVMTQFERPADMSEAAQARRAGYGKTYYDKYANGTVSQQKPVTDGLYRVQVGAYSKPEYARNQLAVIQGKGFEAIVKKIGDYYKVQTGAYSVKANAEAQLARIKAAGFTDAFITTESGGTVVATDTVQEPSYVTYKVKRGDSLWSIAKANLGNGSRWPEIKSLNNLTSNTIYAGQTLKLPD